MPETPEQLHARAATALRTPSVHEWDTWPSEGDIRPKELEPLTPEPVIAGRGGEDCRACWWFIGRPEGFGQLRSSFAEIWDEVLPPAPPPRSGRTTSTASSKR